MVSAGIKTDEDVLKAYNDLKMNKSLRYLILKLNDKQTAIEIEKKGERSETYKDFMDAIPLNEPRYGIFDYQFKTNEAMSRNVERLLFIYWCPDTSKVSFKLPYSTGKEDIKKKLSGIGKHIEAQDISDLDQEQLEKELQK